MGADDEDLDPVGGGPEGLWDILQGGRAGGVYFRGRDLDPEPPDGAGPEHLSSQVFVKAHR